MAEAFGKVSLDGLHKEDSQFTFNISGTVNVPADVGKALSIDTTVANTLKLAGNNERILARLEVYENRTTEGIKVGTAAMDGGYKFPVDPDANASPTGDLPAVGDYLIGAGDGYVKAAGANDPKDWLVVEVKVLNGVTYAVAVKV